MLGLTSQDWHSFTDAAHELLDDVVSSKVLGGLTTDARQELLDDLRLVRMAVLASEEPRIVLVGNPDIPIENILNDLLSHRHSRTEASQIKEELGYGRWYEYPMVNGSVHILDARRGADGELNLQAFEFGTPDAVVGIVESSSEDVDLPVEDLIRAVYKAEDDFGVTPAVVIGIHRDSPQRQVGDFVTQQAVKASFHALGFERNWAEAVQMSRPGAMVRTLLDQVPEQTRMVLARVSSDPRAKTQITDSLVRVCASINATVATIPLPLASTVPITSVQVVMIAGIAYVSGRELNTRSVVEFLAAMGLNVASGLALREVARTVVQVIPVAGPVVSAAIAGKATQVIGRAAQDYFIRG